MLNLPILLEIQTKSFVLNFFVILIYNDYVVIVMSPYKILGWVNLYSSSQSSDLMININSFLRIVT